MLPLESPLEEIPWEKWKVESEIGDRMEFWNQGCDCSLPDLSWHMIMFTPIILIRAIACPLLQECKMIDYWRWLHDVHYIRKYEYPMIRAVNWNNAMVLNENGVVQGPYSHQEWLEHSWFLWDLFFKLKEDPEVFFLNHAFWWSCIYFRHNEDFCAGLYQRFTPIFLLLANYLPDDYSKHRSYADVHSGRSRYAVVSHKVISVQIMSSKCFISF